MLFLYLAMWLGLLAAFLLGLWARGYLAPRGLEGVNAEMSLELAAARTRSQECDAERARLKARVAELTAKLEASEAEPQSDRPADAEGDARTPADEPASAELLELREHAAALEAQAAAARDLRRKLEAAESEIVQLRERAQTNGAAPAIEPGEPPAASDAPAPAAASTAFLDAPEQGRPDDLKRIKGVGPKLESLLNSLGVFYFRQIASWTDDHIAQVDDKIQPKGRIVRDRWVEQARELAGE